MEEKKQIPYIFNEISLQFLTFFLTIPYIFNEFFVKIARKCKENVRYLFHPCE